MTYTPGQLVTYSGACYRVHKMLDDGRVHIIARRRNWHLPGFAKVAPDTVSPWVEPERKRRSNALCQCCGRQIEASAGVIAHHGYVRPQGWHCQTASCYGARFPAFQLSRDRLGHMIEHAIRPHLAACLAHVEALKVPGVKVPGPEFKRASNDPKRIEGVRSTYTYRLMIGPDYVPAVRWEKDYAGFLKLAQGHADRDVTQVEAELAHHQARFDSWKPGTIKGGRS